ncbi:MAG: helix-turn-helix domain-containing protein [Lachnospiraceae bacterium]|nr:helix-turn-helix domain-containing protein [Lachnospiraceae bacterium]
MRDKYDNFLLRLNQYRLRLNMTQEDTSNELGITQSQYSKMELGKTIIPYKIMETLMKMGWDVDYLVTGKESFQNTSELNTLIDRVEESYRKDLLGVAAWFLEQGINKCALNISFETKCEIGILKKMAMEENFESVLYEARKIAGIAQIPMSEKLGVNIKKYRKLEKKQICPDAELLLRIYEETGCKPSLLFECADVGRLIINDLWNCITPPERKNILSLLEQVYGFLKT